MNSEEKFLVDRLEAMAQVGSCTIMGPPFWKDFLTVIALVRRDQSRLESSEKANELFSRHIDDRVKMEEATERKLDIAVKVFEEIYDSEVSEKGGIQPWMRWVRCKVSDALEKVKGE